jgi:hypothetical protein
MATPSPTTPTPVALVHPDSAPAVVAARKVFDEALQLEAGLADRMRRLTAILDPYQESAAPVSADDRLDAVEHITEVRVDYARACRARRAAEAAWQQARHAAREAVRRASRDRKRSLVQQFAGLLQKAALVSRELAEVEDRERDMTGDWHLAGFSWSELAASSPLQASRFDDWRKAATAAGLLGDSTT